MRIIIREKTAGGQAPNCSTPRCRDKAETRENNIH
jgi:hypothetical protein